MKIYKKEAQKYLKYKNEMDETNNFQETEIKIEPSVEDQPVYDGSPYERDHPDNQEKDPDNNNQEKDIDHSQKKDVDDNQEKVPYDCQEKFTNDNQEKVPYDCQEKVNDYNQEKNNDPNQEKVSGDKQEKVTYDSQKKITAGDKQEKVTNDNQEKNADPNQEKFSGGNQEKVTGVKQEKVNDDNNEKVTRGDNQEKVTGVKQEKVNDDNQKKETENFKRNTQTEPQNSTAIPETVDDPKFILFVGDVSPVTTEGNLKNYFQRWGNIRHIHFYQYDNNDGRERNSFGFVHFSSTSEVDAVQAARPHGLDGKMIRTMRAVPILKEPLAGCRIQWLYVRNLGPDINFNMKKQAEYSRYFSRFGTIIDSLVIQRKDYFFIKFDDYDSVDKVLVKGMKHTIGNSVVLVKKSNINHGDDYDFDLAPTEYPQATRRKDSRRRKKYYASGSADRHHSDTSSSHDRYLPFNDSHSSSSDRYFSSSDRQPSSERYFSSSEMKPSSDKYFLSSERKLSSERYFSSSDRQLSSDRYFSSSERKPSSDRYFSSSDRQPSSDRKPSSERYSSSSDRPSTSRRDRSHSSSGDRHSSNRGRESNYQPESSRYAIDPKLEQMEDDDHYSQSNSSHGVNREAKCGRCDGSGVVMVPCPCCQRPLDPGVSSQQVEREHPTVRRRSFESVSSHPSGDCRQLLNRKKARREIPQRHDPLPMMTSEEDALKRYEALRLTVSSLRMASHTITSAMEGMQYNYGPRIAHHPQYDSLPQYDYHYMRR